ncbi:DUF6266 family protein [Leeuwenhoekiella polynyae]|uniref:Uncharacterized protein n=1 Tax=Leeuwenhoekiella polynyae TaxID=1550906 RepID=A0A4Q0P3X6_9FLAO|nr:DUF6266 family protein [Leeuwenhoekiella polynyae]RXG21264.1 hypothetical protein DSM02_2117 [Leeuwenhoekiella polynyae]
MGQFIENQIGMISGAVGPVVFVKESNGKTILRSKPTPSKKPISAKQQQNRNKFALMKHFTGLLYPIFKECYTDFLGKDNARDAVRSYYMEQVIQTEQEALRIAYEKVLISTGRVRAYIPVSQARDAQQVVLHWQGTTQQPFAEAGDLLSVLLYAPDTEDFVFYKACATRVAATHTLELPEALSTQPLEVYTTFSTAAETDYAYSTYLGRLD